MMQPRNRTVPAVATLAAWILLSGWPLIGAAGEWRYDGQALSGGTSRTGKAPAVEPGTGNGGDIEALQARVENAPDDAALLLSLAQAHAAADQPGKALDACARAAALQPADIEIRRHCARYAEWAGDLPASREHFGALLALAPDDEEALLGAARAQGWSGNLRRSAGYYDRYLELYPDNPDAWIEYAQVRAWQGDFATALEALEAYRDRHGETDRYREEKARYLAWDNRPRKAMAINTPLLETEPENYERLYTRAVALGANKQTGAALSTVEELERVRPGSDDTRLLDRVLRTPTRSTLRLGGHYYDDSDTIEIRGVDAEARLQLNHRTALFAGAAYASLNAATGSGFETVGGQETTRYDRAWIGAAYRFNPLAELSGSIGQTDIDNAGDFTSYEIELNLRPADELGLSLLRRREIHAPSPRAASLSINTERNVLALNWRPDYRYTLESVLSYDELSDGNARRELILAPRRSVLRTDELNADLGLHFDWLSFDEELNNGYYDPERYQRYAATLFGYGKLSEDHGLSLVATAGFHKDDEMSDFEFGYDVVGELTFGLYTDWMTVLRADYSDRYQESGSYDGWNVSLDITRRF